MDECDMADKRIIDMIESGRRSAAIGLQSRLSATGYCFNCGEELPPGMRWCDADCTQDWERRTGREAI